MSTYQVEFSIVIQVEADDEDQAFEKAEPLARAQALAGVFDNYDDCVTEIES